MTAGRVRGERGSQGWPEQQPTAAHQAPQVRSLHSRSIRPLVPRQQQTAAQLCSSWRACGRCLPRGLTRGAGARAAAGRLWSSRPRPWPARPEPGGAARCARRGCAAAGRWRSPAGGAAGGQSGVGREGQESARSLPARVAHAACNAGRLPSLRWPRSAWTRSRCLPGLLAPGTHTVTLTPPPSAPPRAAPAPPPPHKKKQKKNAQSPPPTCNSSACSCGQVCTMYW